MKKLKVMTIVGTRPEVIKLSRVMAELDLHTDHVLVHTGQNYDRQLNQVFFEEMRLKEPKHILGVAGKTSAETISQVILKSDEILEQEKPDAVLIYGDTNSCLSVISAKRRKIPVFHMEAGNRCFDQRVPEELNRKIVDHLSDINLPLTEHARGYLLAEGIQPDRIIKSGSTMREVLNHYQSDIARSDVLKRQALAARDYILVSLHREENVADAEKLRTTLSSINDLGKTFGKKLLFSTHPRTHQALTKEGLQNSLKNISFSLPLGFFDYVQLQKQAFCVVSDSGTLTEESSLLGFPAVMLREAHERPEGMDQATAVLCAPSTASEGRLAQAIQLVTTQAFEHGFQSRPVSDYQFDDVSKKIVRIILSYTDFVNRVVWSR